MGRCIGVVGQKTARKRRYLIACDKHLQQNENYKHYHTTELPFSKLVPRLTG